MPFFFFLTFVYASEGRDKIRPKLQGGQKVACVRDVDASARHPSVNIP